MSLVDRARTLTPSTVLILALVVCSWLALVAWGDSPFSRYLDHRYQPDGLVPWAGTLALFFVGWLLMASGMMLGTTTQLVEAFLRLARRRSDGVRLVATLNGGILAVWIVVGYGFRIFDVGVHALVDSSGFLQRRPQVIAGALLLATGIFEATPLKQRCLTACRSPESFVYRHWRGRSASGDAFRIGAAYGVSCVGCCWALMLVVFALAALNIAWMLAFGALMTIEKSTSFGPALAAPFGVLLAGAGVALLFL